MTAIHRGSESGRFCEYSDRGARAAIKRLADEAGIGDVSSHDLRSTFATEAYRHSHDLRGVQEILGHASSATTEGYTGIDMDTMRRVGAI